MVTFKNGNMVIIDGEEENRLLYKFFTCPPENAKLKPTVNHRERNKNNNCSENERNTVNYEQIDESF